MSINTKNIAIFAGSASLELAGKIAEALGINLGDMQVEHFADGEFSVYYKDSIRGKDVFLVQSTYPSSDNIMELLLMVDAAKRASAHYIAAVIPYFGWARQDRKDKPRVSIGAKLMADLLSTAGVTRVITMDLHADQIQGFFDIPVDNIYAAPILLSDITKRKLENTMVVSPDVGGVVRARALAKRLDCELAIIDKRRQKANVSEVMNIIGEVSGRSCLLMDDMVDTAGTLCRAAEALKKHGAVRVSAYCTHPVLSGKAIERITESPLDELVVTDTIPLTDEGRACGKIRVLGCGQLIGETILRINRSDSVSMLFME